MSARNLINHSTGQTNTGLIVNRALQGVRNQPQANNFGSMASSNRNVNIPAPATTNRYQYAQPSSGNSYSTARSQGSDLTVSNKVQTLPFKDGRYKITLVHSAKEIYGYPITRDNELMTLSKELNEYYQKNIADQEINQSLPLVGEIFVIQQDDHFHRVKIQSRADDVRLQIKFIDRGDECLSDVSEILKLTKGFETLPPLVHQFSLAGCDDLQTSNQVTRFLKSSLFNKTVDVKLNKMISSGVFDVKMSFDDGESVNAIAREAINNPNNPKLIKYMKQVSNEALGKGNSTTFQNPDSSHQQYRYLGNSENNQRSYTNTSEQQQLSVGYNHQSYTTSQTFFAGKSNQSNSTPPNNNMSSQQTRNPTGITRTVVNQYHLQNQNKDIGNYGGQSTTNSYQSSQQNSGRDDYPDRPNGRQFNNSNRGNYSHSNNYSNSKRPTNGQQSNSDDTVDPRNRGRSFGVNNSSQRGTNEQQGGGSSFYKNRPYDDAFSGSFRRGGPGQNPLPMSSPEGGKTETFTKINNPQTQQEAFVEPENYREPERLHGMIKFVISHFESAVQFYIQTQSSENELKSLSDKLQRQRLNWPSFVPNPEQLNQPCLAQDEDSCWYRAKILSATENEANIRFVDYGNTRTVKKSELLKISKPYTEKAPFAIKCNLAVRQGSRPVEISELNSLVSGKSFQCVVKEYKEGVHIINCEELQKIFVGKGIVKMTQINRPLKDALVSHVDEKRFLFYIQDQELLETIDNLIKEETQTASTVPNDEVDRLPKDTKLLADYQDDYYRGVINSVIDENQVNIFYIDFGNTDVCPKSALKLCSTQLSSYQPLAKPCKLYGISDTRQVEAIASVAKYMEDDGLQVAFVKEVNKENHVLLYVKQQCINEKFGYDPFNEEEEGVTDTQTTSVSNRQELPIPDERKEVSTTSTITSDETTPTVPLNEQQTASTIAIAEDKNDTAEIDTKLPVDSPIPDNTSSAIPQTETSETQINDDEYIQGLLVFTDPNQPIVYLQVQPDAEAVLAEIEEKIAVLTQESNQSAEYAVGEYVIALYSLDEIYYRARITAYSSDTSTYTVTFIDYGNSDEGVKATSMYKYSKELEDIEPQVKRLKLFNVDNEMWENKVKEEMENYLDETLNFRFVDETRSTIIIKQLETGSASTADEQTENTETEDLQDVNKESIGDEQPIEHEVVVDAGEQDGQVQSRIEQILSGCVSSIGNDYIYIQLQQDKDSKLIQLATRLAECDKVQQNDGSWKVEDLCLVLNDDNHYCRARILIAHENKYDLQLIDYGSTLENKENHQLFVITDEDIFNQSPLSHLCRLHEVDHNKSTSEVIDNLTHAMSNNVTIKFQVHNDLNSTCWSITLVEEQSQAMNTPELEKTVLQSPEVETQNSAVSSIEPQAMDVNELKAVVESSDGTNETT